jgi:hypothetical protein
MDGALRHPERRAQVSGLAVVLDALLDEGTFEERVRWSQVCALAVDLTPVPAASNENEAVVEAVLVRSAGSRRLAAVVVDDASARHLTEHGDDTVHRGDLSVELGLRGFALHSSHRTQIYKTPPAAGG